MFIYNVMIIFFFSWKVEPGNECKIGCVSKIPCPIVEFYSKVNKIIIIYHDKKTKFCLD